ncbi:thiol peroxidase [soil metagenome]
MADRTGLTAFKGGPLTLAGSGSVKAGDTAPDFKVSKTLTDDIKLSDFAGKNVVLSVVPSLDTGICAIQTNRFNAEASKLGGDTVFLTISADLPVAQDRFCKANNATAVTYASDYKHHDFGDKYGLNIKELGLLARAVYVIDRDGVIKYAEIVPEVTTEPKYDGALEALKKIS